MDDMEQLLNSCSGRRTRKLNDLDDDSIGSGSSEYENSPSENEREGKEHEDLVSRGCRRSRRLKRKYGDDEKSESSESEDDTFVRRSTRRRRPTSKTYMEYESDDTPEEVLMKKSKIIEDNDEYVVSQSDEDPEDILRIRKRRTIISDDEDDDQETIEEDVETDFEDEELCADMEKNVVSDDSEVDAIQSLSEEEEPEENDSGETTTDDERYEEESNGSGKRKRSAKDAQEKKRGGKDMRTIMKSIREEEVCSSKKLSKEEEVEKEPSIKEAEVKSEKETISSATFACKESAQGEKHTGSALIKEDTSDLKTQIVSNEDKVECPEVADNTNMENKETIGANIKPSQGSTTDSPLTNIAVKGELEEKAARPPDLINDQVKDTRKKLTLPLKDVGGHHKTRGGNERPKHGQVKLDVPGLDAPVLRPSFSGAHAPRTSGHSQETIELSSYSQTMRHPIGPSYNQGSSTMMSIQHQPDILRPRPYAADVMRPTDHYNQPIGNYSPMHTPFHLHSPYHGYMDQQSFFSPNMQPFTRGAPPAYPGYPGNDPQALWRPQSLPQIQWNYPPYRAGSPHIEQKQRALQMHRPVPDAHTYRGSSSPPASNTKVAKTQSRVPTVPHYGAESPRRPKTSSADSRKPSTMESYAAFRNMVIAPSDDKGQKKAKRT